MIRSKHPLDARRLRKNPPRGFGWIDHRLLSEGYFERLSAPATALYCLLVCAADRQGLSYYSDRRLSCLLGLDSVALKAARGELIAQRLLAFEAPLCQILALDGFEPQPLPRSANMQPLPRSANMQPQPRSKRGQTDAAASASPADNPVIAQPAASEAISPRQSLREMLRISLEARAAV